MTLSDIKKAIIPPKPYRKCVVAYFMMGILLYGMAVSLPMPRWVQFLIEYLKPFLGALQSIARFAQLHGENPLPSQLMTIYGYFFSLFLFVYCFVTTFRSEEYKEELLGYIQKAKKKDVFISGIVGTVLSVAMMLIWLDGDGGGGRYSAYLYSSHILSALFARLFWFYCFPALFAMCAFELYAAIFLNVHAQSEDHHGGK